MTGAKSPAVPLASKAKAKILVVDDEPANRKLLADLVVREGYEAVIATGGADALAILADVPVDLVLLDLMMPEVDGMAVLAELQKRHMLPALPVVVVTAHDERKVRIDALSAGAVDFIAKPIDRLEVVCRIRTLVELRQLRAHAVATVEDQLREADHLLRLGFEQSPVAKISWDTSFRALAWNPAAEKLFGYTYAEAIGQHAAFLVPEVERVHVDAIGRELLGGRVNESTNENVTKDGRTIHCEWHNAPLTSADGTALGVSSVVLDVTERVRLKATLAQAQKMEAMGQLAGGIAHDFNNILAVILSYGSFLQEELPEGDERQDDIVEILKAGRRAAGLTRQLLAFSRQQPVQKRPVNLNHSLAEIHKLLVRTLGANVALKLIPSARPAVVQIDPLQFDQIALNLAVNARDAMPNGGQLQISLEHPPEPTLEHDERCWVHLRVTDTGIGMDERTQQRIFEPFFTTKEKGKGTGLGLATCFGIVADAGGQIRVKSAPGQGTTFTVELPLCAEEVDSVIGAAKRLPRDGHGEIVLVAEDNSALRKAAARVLERAGYTVHVAADGHEAIKKLDELGPRLDILVSDVTMPGPDGYEVAEHARRIAPGAACLLTSGFLDEAARGRQSADLPILSKPITPHDLARAVAEALAARPASGAPATVHGVADGDMAPRPVPKTSAERDAPPAPARRPASRPSSAPPVRTERVLIVDDDESLAAASRRILVDDFEVVVVGTLSAARGALGDGAFDALVLDVGLPDGDGLELLQELRGTSELPVVMVTGALSTEAAAQAVRGRVNEFLPKPFEPAELLRSVRSAVETGRVSRLRTQLLAARFGGDEFVKDIAATEKSFARAMLKVRMVFQPIVRAADGSVFGYEALLRCDEPSIATPLRLLTAAELLGRVEDVGRVVRASVAATMLAEPDRVEAIFLNIHPLELRADLLAEATDPLLAVAHQVILEITERASIEGGAKLDGELARIRQLGYRLAVDDLGEGYAGLASLVHLRPDIAKIDMSLVREIHRMPLKRDIVAALVDMARRSGIIVVAEGIETVEERDTLIELGCDLLQGYLFARPGPPFPVPRTSFERTLER